MDVAIAFAVFSAALVFSVLSGVSIVAPLLLGSAVFSCAALYRGHSIRAVVKMNYAGVKKSMSVLYILLILGVLTGLWRVGGTVPLFVYYGVKAMAPRFFVLSAFIITCCFAYAIGSVFGVVGTIGVVLMLLAQSGGVDPRVAAGAVLSGAFFGDRGAPTSSSANLVATLTGTDLYTNVKNMFKTAFIPMLLTLSIYFCLSLTNPIKIDDSSVISEIASSFDLKPVMALPAAVVLLLPLMGVNVKRAMGAGILASAAISICLGNIGMSELLSAAVVGYVPKGSGRIEQLMGGGGVLSMLRVVGIVLIASTYSGIFDGTGMLKGIQAAMERLSRRLSLFIAMIAASVITSAFACNQTLAVMLTSQLMNDIYDRRGVSRQVLAIDLENTVILIAGLVPWCIAVAVPLDLMSVDAGSIPYAVFLWLVPLVELLRSKRT